MSIKLDYYGLREYDEIEDKRIVLLQSGGLDSCVLASVFHSLGFEIHHLFVDYGFRSAKRDLSNAKKIASKYGGIDNLHIAKMSLPWLEEATNLVGGDEVDDAEANGALNTYYAGTYVPMRNAFLISIAWSLAESLEIPYVVSALDGSQSKVDRKPLGGTSDKHPWFVSKLEDALNEGSSYHHVTGKNIRLLTPVMGLYKTDIIQIGELFDTDFSISNSCYNGHTKPCGKCSACLARKEAFNLIRVKDPLEYEN